MNEWSPIMFYFVVYLCSCIFKGECSQVLSYCNPFIEHECSVAYVLLSDEWSKHIQHSTWELGQRKTTHIWFLARMYHSLWVQCNSFPQKQTHLLWICLCIFHWLLGWSKMNVPFSLAFDHHPTAKIALNIPFIFSPSKGSAL